MSFWIKTCATNDERNTLIYEDQDPQEIEVDTRGELFRILQKEYGQCISKQYLDYEGKAVVIGWVFRRRREYADNRWGCKDTYLHDTWVTIVEPKQVKVERTVYIPVGIPAEAYLQA